MMNGCLILNLQSEQRQGKDQLNKKKKKYILMVGVDNFYLKSNNE